MGGSLPNNNARRGVKGEKKTRAWKFYLEGDDGGSQKRESSFLSLYLWVGRAGKLR